MSHDHEKKNDGDDLLESLDDLGYGKAAPGKSKEEIAHEAKMRALAVEKAIIENELLTYQLEDLRLKKARKAQTHVQNEKDLMAQVKSEEFRSRRCNHRKGGKGMAAIQGRGHDAMYCIIKHTMPTGEVFVKCTRCPKLWRPSPDPVAQAEYLVALEWPTDNEPSGSCIWQFRRDDGSQEPIRWGQELTQGEVIAT